MTDRVPFQVASTEKGSLTIVVALSCYILNLCTLMQKLVNETFQSMWFTAVKLSSKELSNSRLLQRVMNITDVVAACRDSGFEWLEQLLDNVSRYSLFFVLCCIWFALSCKYSSPLFSYH